MIALKSIIGPDRLFNIVVPTYRGSYKLEVLINCFLAQTCNDWQLTIVSDGEEKDTENIIKKYPYDNISYYHTDVRFNDFGHSPRRYGLETSNSTWTILTGFDNYYVPVFIEEFKRVYENNPDASFIYCNFVLNHLRQNLAYNCIDTQLFCDHIDMGCFATKTDLLKSIGFVSTAYAADWILVDNVIKRNVKMIKIPETLYIHN